MVAASPSLPSRSRPVSASAPWRGADARQAQEAGAALDRVDVSNRLADQRRVGGVLLDAHELHRRSVDVFGRLGEKLR